MKGRYTNLLRAIQATVGNSRPHKPYRIVEIGVWRADRALEMIQHAMKLGRRNVEYYGFDLFEDLFLKLPDAQKEAELSKSLPPLPVDMVYRKLATTGAKIALFEGFTVDTLPPASQQLPPADVIFLDGGHSLETIANDWGYASRLMHDKTVMILDDYFPNRTDAGCRPLVYSLDRREYDVEVVEPTEHFEHTGLTINVVWVTKAKKLAA